MLIPIHAYPVMNETKFPKSIDFGQLALGETASRTITMQCKASVPYMPACMLRMCFSCVACTAHPCMAMLQHGILYVASYWCKAHVLWLGLHLLLIGPHGL